MTTCRYACSRGRRGARAGFLSALAKLKTDQPLQPRKHVYEQPLHAIFEALTSVIITCRHYDLQRLDPSATSRTTPSLLAGPSNVSIRKKARGLQLPKLTTEQGSRRTMELQRNMVLPISSPGMTHIQASWLSRQYQRRIQHGRMLEHLVHPPQVLEENGYTLSQMSEEELKGHKRCRRCMGRTYSRTPAPITLPICIVLAFAHC